MHARHPKRLPVVLSQTEVARLLVELRDDFHLMASLLYGSGLRLMECLTLRIKDVDLDRRQLTIRQAKGKKDRTASSIPTHHANCAGNGYSPQHGATSIQLRARRDAITSTRQRFSVRCATQDCGLAS